MSLRGNGVTAGEGKVMSRDRTRSGREESKKISRISQDLGEAVKTGGNGVRN